MNSLLDPWNIYWVWLTLANGVWCFYFAANPRDARREYPIVMAVWFLYLPHAVIAFVMISSGRYRLKEDDRIDL